MTWALIRCTIRPVGSFLLLAALFGAAGGPELDGVAGEGSYEERLVRRAIVATGLPRHERPEGLPIGRILVLTHDVITPEDPYPQILNLVHVTSRPHVVERELLFAAGQPYRQASVDETERNLRGMAILALARIVPLRGQAPGTVDVLVVTRDLWSLRFNSSYRLIGSLLEYVWLRPTEENLAGLNKRLSLDLDLRLDTFTFGQLFLDRRVFGTRWSFLESAAVVLNRQGGTPEGTRGYLVLSRPLYALEVPWGVHLDFIWDVRTRRKFRGGERWLLEPPEGGAIPWTYRRRELAIDALYLRSHGQALKAQGWLGVGARSRRSGVPLELGLSDATRAWFERTWLPRSEEVAFATASLRLFTPTYRVMQDVETFALSEDYQVGPSVRGEVRGGGLWGGGLRPFVEAGFTARWQQVWGDDLFAVRLAGSARHDPQADAPYGLVNRRAAAEVSNVSPRLWGLRLATRAMYELRSFDLDNEVLTLGGGTGLRGTAPVALSGGRRVLFNAEVRTRPFELWTVHGGAVLFWDAGASVEPSRKLVHSVGLGLRLLIPQFDVEPIRLDFGWVLNADGPPPLERFSSSFGQVTRERSRLFEAPLD